MNDYLKVILASMVSGFVLGAVVVASNKKAQQLVKDGTNAIEEKYEEVKQMVEKQMKEKDKENKPK
ncbi:MAG: hypothetical protein RR334_01960 [Clostridia bacterium]